MKKTINREYVLEPHEVRSALWRYLKEQVDQPTPDDADKLNIKWNSVNGDAQAFVSFTETSDVQ